MPQPSSNLQSRPVLPHTNTNKPETAVNISIHVVLTDGEHTHDSRNIHPVDLFRLTEIAQEESNGELWWEPHSIFLGRKMSIAVKVENQLSFDLVTESFTPLATTSMNLQLCLDAVSHHVPVNPNYLNVALRQIDKLTQMLRIVQHHFIEAEARDYKADTAVSELDAGNGRQEPLE